MSWDEAQTEALKILITIISYPAIIIYICMPSQLLSNATNDLFKECYFIKWYTYPPKARLMLLIIMRRSMKDFYTVAGPIIILNIENCSLIIKRSVLFIAAFRSVFQSVK
ncbi:hypothetical protein TKK_0010541 [Trichogramma kaykai]